ncbi:MAG: hypothetical protein ACK5PP_15255 [Acidimicrobiales bacterium]
MAGALAAAVVATVLVAVPVRPAAAAPAPTAQCHATRLHDGTHRVGWSAGPGADYVVYRQVEPSTRRYWRGRVDGPATTWVDTGNPASGATQYLVRTTPDGAWDPSPAVTCLVGPDPVPVGSVTVEADPTTGAVQVRFPHVTGVAGYNLHRQAAGAEPQFVRWTSAAAATGPDGLTITLVDDQVAPGTTATWWVEPTRHALNGDRTASPSLTVTGPEPWTTARIDGRWELVQTADPTTPARWEAVSVRADVPAFAQLDQADMAEVATRFNAIRLVLHWSDVQPTRDASVADHLDTTILPFLQWADAEGVDVILDPLHLGGGAEAGFWIPQWAWDDAWSAPQTNNDGTAMTATALDFGGATSAPVQDQHHPNDSLEVLTWNVPAADSRYPAADRGQELAYRYLEDVADWLAGHEAAGLGSVAALELVNEPHPYRGNFYANSATAAEIQKAWAAGLRDVLADKPLVVTGFYGGMLSDADAVAQVYQAEPVVDHLVYSAHSYTTGVADPDRPDVDELRDHDNAPADGYGDATAAKPYWRGAKTGVSAESDRRTGCYGSDATWSASSTPRPCPTTVADTVRAETRDRMIRNTESQDAVAQAAGMPLFLGELGVIPYARRNGIWKGWGHAELLLCDRVTALHSLHGGVDSAGRPLDRIEAPSGQFDEVSFAVWHLSTRAGGFGLYDPSTDTWLDRGETAGLDFGANPANQAVAEVFNPAASTPCGAG